ncbi:glycosyltransferase family 2 protein [Aquabacterium olei]|nr:glycosyltransferase family 2 protein [Aquabacterium olei]
MRGQGSKGRSAHPDLKMPPLSPVRVAPDQAAPARIGLCMIVKNEAHVIRRCLDSVLPLIDHVFIEDTGSTDGTQAVVRAWLAEHGVPGDVVDVPWQDFAFNRSDALARLREQRHIDYALVIDADDTLVYPPGFDARACKASLKDDVIDVDIAHGAIRYQRPLLLRNGLPFRYRGVLHEYVAIPPEAKGRSTLDGVHMQYNSGGDRSRDPQKFHKDAAVLACALRTETDPFLRSRYTFYLAQSLKDSGQIERALAAYQQRAEMGYWEEEVFVALYRAGQLQERLGHPAQQVIDTWLRATAAQPARAEALHAASRLCRLQKRYEQGYWFAKRGLGPRPPSGLFVESWIYDHGLLDELAVNAYWSGRYAECRTACERLLEERQLPTGMRERVQENLRFAIERLT